MNIKNIDKRGPAYGSFLEVSCRGCGEIPIFVAKYKDDGKEFDLDFPNDWYIEKDTNEQPIHVLCSKCSRCSKCKYKIQNEIYQRN